MAKVRTHYVCQNCGGASPKWLGRCPSCGNWNTLVEETVGDLGGAPQEDSLAAFREELRNPAERGRSEALSMGELAGSGEKSLNARWDVGIAELNRVLGGGLVRDSFVLLGGDPGIGKSTLLLQMADGLTAAEKNLKILYVSGEESIEQIRARAKRLGVKNQDRILLAAETQLERALEFVKKHRPEVIVLDSLQTFATRRLESAPGSVGQVREIAARLMTLAKSAGVCVWLVGHVTKDGSIAGPKVVEHMVDTVLYFEGESTLNYRLLRTVKNRFGSTRELGVFEMFGEGLREVKNPSSLFLSERENPVAGTAVAASLEGSRPLLVELQALITPCHYGVPRRTAVGMESQRIALLAAVIEKHLKLPLSNSDLFFNVSGGLRISEPACDLGAVAAIYSSAKDIAFPHDWIFIGEVSLTGELRRASRMEARIEEAEKLGFKTLVLPRSGAKSLGVSTRMRLVQLGRVEDLSRLQTEPSAKARASRRDPSEKAAPPAF